MKRLILLAPGAGAPSSHAWMQNWKQHLSELGVVETFDYDHMREGRKRPDPLARLIAAHLAALRKFVDRESRFVNREEPTPRRFLIGKSMGGRIGCHVSLEEKVDGLVCLGYPLCAMGDRTKLRDEVLRALTTPIVFVQGTRDALCPLDLLEQVRVEMKAPNFCTLSKAAIIPCAYRSANCRQRGRRRNMSITRFSKQSLGLLTNCQSPQIRSR